MVGISVTAVCVLLSIPEVGEVTMSRSYRSVAVFVVGTCHLLLCPHPALAQSGVVAAETVSNGTFSSETWRAWNIMRTQQQVGRCRHCLESFETPDVNAIQLHNAGKLLYWHPTRPRGAGRAHQMLCPPTRYEVRRHRPALM